MAKENVVRTKNNEEYRKCIYRRLDLYKKDYDSLHPLVCMGEKSKQLLEDNRHSIASRPGSLEKYDYEYKKKDTCNIFVAIAPKAGMRYTKVTDTRKKCDFAYFILDLVENHFPKAEYIQLVMDNLNTHLERSLLETFGELKIKELMKKLRFIYTPKHASWLNMEEIEINIIDRQCADTKIESKEKWTVTIGKWTKDRNENKCTIEWKFTRQHADKKLSKHYIT